MNFLHFSISFGSEAGLYLARFIGLSPKNRIKKTVNLDKDLLEIFEGGKLPEKVRGGSLSDVLNYGLLLVLVSQGLIDSGDPQEEGKKKR